MSDQPPATPQPTPAVETPEPPAIQSGELPGMAFVDLWGKKKDADGNPVVVKIGISEHAATSFEALKKLLATVALAEAELHMHPYELYKFATKAAPAAKPAATTAAPATTTAATTPPVDRLASLNPAAAVPPPATVTPAPAAAVQPPAQGVTTQKPPVQGVQELHCSRLEVIALPDGRSKINFWADPAFHPKEQKYPYLYETKTPAQIVELMRGAGAWTEQHFSVSANYQVKLLVQWQPSPTNRTQKGNPYKDIVRVLPSA